MRSRTLRSDRSEYDERMQVAVHVGVIPPERGTTGRCDLLRGSVAAGAGTGLHGLVYNERGLGLAASSLVAPDDEGYERSASRAIERRCLHSVPGYGGLCFTC